MSAKTYPDELLDFNPRSWLSKYRKTTVPYLLKMAFFYHILGLALMYAGSAIVVEVVPGYEIPQIPVSATLALAAGSMEESLFFGIPYYLSFNHYLVLFTGILWSAVHIFNTESFTASNLAFGGFLFTVPHIFFSLRTWVSGKGWFAIAFHSSWNVAVLFSFCAAGLRVCTAFGSGDSFMIDLLSLIIGASLIPIVYLLYKKSKNKQYKIKHLIIAPIAVLVIAEILLAQQDIIRIFSAV